jgi:ATP-dependent RNA helicase DHX57
MENLGGNLAQEIDSEKEALEMIYPDALKHQVQETGHLISITLPWNGQTIVNFYLSLSSKYPFEIPGLSLDNDALPAYIKLALYKELVKEFTHALGLPMMFSITSWILENGDQVIAHPPSLVSLHETVASVDQSSSKQISVQKTKIQKAFKSLPWERERILDIRASDKFQKMLVKRRKLPSYEFKNQILDSIQKNQIIIISGETGCGKSTQTGQFILEACFETKSPCNIICTQPRRLSATSLAKRVSDEQCQELGKLVGYRIRGESRSSPETKLTFVTTGILLRMIQFNPLIPEVTHIIFDEVHERTLDGDFLMILLKHLANNRRDIKIILMSATINSGDFSTYFNAPIISIPGFTYPVEDLYLEDYVQELGFSETDYFKTRSNKSRIDDEGEGEDEDDLYFGNSHISNYLKSVNKGLEGINYTLIAKLVKFICSSNDDSGAILIFLPGTLLLIDL